MGCDIHMVFERQTARGYETVYPDYPHDQRDYTFFGWLAGVRRPLETPPVAKQRGLPADFTGYVPGYPMDFHNHSWVSIHELADYDYDQLVEPAITVRDRLGPLYFLALGEWIGLGVDRIVFWFDN